MSTSTKTLNLSRRQKQVLNKMASGYYLWRYSTNGFGYLNPPMSVRSYHPSEKIAAATIEALENAGAIEEDEAASTYRSESGSDLVYRIVSPTAPKS